MPQWPARKPSQINGMDTQIAADRSDVSLRVYYNGSCPLCRVEIEHYRKRADRHGVNGVVWQDVTAAPGVLAGLGLDDDAVVRRLHVVDNEGRLHAGVDAFVAVWQRIPGYQWMARIATVRWVRPVAEILYERVLAPALYRWNKATGRVPPSPSQA